MSSKWTLIFMAILNFFHAIRIPFFLSNITVDFSSLKKETVAALTIPSISLEQELYSKDDKRNNIDERLIFLDSSSTPDIEKGNVIIAGHSGYGDIAYFKNLYKLKLGDLVYLTYFQKKYTYQIVDMYKVPKTGKVEVIRDSNKKTITLITCSGNKEQLIVIGEQKSNT